MNEIKCPHDLNQFLLGEPIFENSFPEKECEQRKFYGDCYHCFSTAIASRDHKLKNIINRIRINIEELPTTLIDIERPNSIVERYVIELDSVFRILNKYKEEIEKTESSDKK